LSTSIPYVSVRPGYISVYSRMDSKRVRSQAQIECERYLRDNNPIGNISLKAERRVKQAIDWLLYLSKDKVFYHNKFKRNYHFRINFVTLTLPSQQVHTDQELKAKCLNHILTLLRTRWGVKNYVWRAEAQRNGNIHFHICTDAYVPWNELRNSWNKIVGKLGYIESFKEKHGHKTPNSTDVHAIHKIRNISAYLAKYCTKNSPNRAIEGKLWGLSHGLSQIRSAVDMRYNELEDELRQIFKKFESKVRVSEYVTVCYASVKEWACVVKGRLYSMFMRYVLYHRDGCPTDPYDHLINIPVTSHENNRYISKRNNPQLMLTL